MEVQNDKVNTRKPACKKHLTSPELATHFAEEKANGQQAKSGWRTKNASPVVMQILPQATGKSLRDGIYVHRLKCMWTSFCVGFCCLLWTASFRALKFFSFPIFIYYIIFLDVFIYFAAYANKMLMCFCLKVPIQEDYFQFLNTTLLTTVQCKQRT